MRYKETGTQFVQQAFPQTDHEAILYLAEVQGFDREDYTRLLNWYHNKPRCYSHVLQAPLLWQVRNPGWLNKFSSPKGAIKDLKMPWQLRWISVPSTELNLYRALFRGRTDFGTRQKPSPELAKAISRYLNNIYARQIGHEFADWMIKKLDMENMEMKMTHFSSLRDLANYKRRHNQAWPHKWTVQQALAAHDRMVAEQNKTRLDQYDGRTEHWPEDLPRELTLADGSVLTACTTQQRMVRESLTYGHCCGHGVGKIYWTNQVKGVGAIYHMDCANGHGYTVEVIKGYMPKSFVAPDNQIYIRDMDAGSPAQIKKLVYAVWHSVQIQGKSGTRPGNAVTEAIDQALKEHAQFHAVMKASKGMNAKASDDRAPSSAAPRV